MATDHGLGRISCSSDTARFVQGGVVKPFRCVPQMRDDSPYKSPAEAAPTVRPRRLRRWFLGGFAIVFVAMLILMNQYYYTGDALVQCKLWQFYLLGMRRARSYRRTSLVQPLDRAAMPL
mgnify:CR=1 FL=1